MDGWTPKQETTYEYDQGGRLIRSRTWVEPEWDAQQAGWMLALAVYDTTRCPLCGGDRAECQAPENADRYAVEDPTRCHRATALHAAQREYEDQPGFAALLWRADLPENMPEKVAT